MSLRDKCIEAIDGTVFPPTVAEAVLDAVLDTLTEHVREWHLLAGGAVLTSTGPIRGYTEGGASETVLLDHLLAVLRATKEDTE